MQNGYLYEDESANDIDDHELGRWLHDTARPTARNHRSKKHKTWSATEVSGNHDDVYMRANCRRQLCKRTVIAG